MKLRSNRLDQFGIGITLLTLLVGLVLWDRLPSKIAVHFSAAGDAGVYVSKTIGVVLIPLSMIIAFVVMRRAARFDPPDDNRAFVVTIVGSMIFLAALQFLVLGWNLGYQISFIAVLGATIVWFAVLIGYSAWRTGSVFNT